jgi:hypothetical protein
MSKQNITEGMGIIEANRGRAFFAGRRNIALVVAAEGVIGGSFPPSYREFVLQLGAGNFGSTEFYGVIDENFYDSEVPNGIWLTLRERVDSKLPFNYIIVSATGDGAFYCVEMSRETDTPVFIFHPNVPRSAQVKREIIARDFGEFFLTQIRQQI